MIFVILKNDQDLIWGKPKGNPGGESKLNYLKLDRFDIESIYTIQKHFI